MERFFVPQLFLGWRGLTSPLVVISQSETIQLGQRGETIGKTTYVLFLQSEIQGDTRR
jgi:hypothetical protein